MNTIKETKHGKERRKPKPFTEDEINKLLDKVPVVFADEPANIPRYKTLIRFMSSTGVAIVDGVQLERSVLEHATEDGRSHHSSSEDWKASNDPNPQGVLERAAGRFER